MTLCLRIGFTITASLQLLPLPSSPPPQSNGYLSKGMPSTWHHTEVDVGEVSIAFFKAKVAPCYPHDAGIVPGSAIMFTKTSWAIHSSKNLNEPLSLQAMAWKPTMPWYLAKGRHPQMHSGISCNTCNMECLPQNLGCKRNCIWNQHFSVPCQCEVYTNQICNATPHSIHV